MLVGGLCPNTTLLAFVTTSSFISVWCVRALNELYQWAILTKQSIAFLNKMSLLPLSVLEKTERSAAPTCVKYALQRVLLIVS